MLRSGERCPLRLRASSAAVLALFALLGALMSVGGMAGCAHGDSSPGSDDGGGGGDAAFGADATTMSEDAGAADASGADATFDAPGSDSTPVLACATPMFAPGPGPVSPDSSVTLTSMGLPANGFIFYTTDGSPNHGSHAVLSGGQIQIAASETVSAIAYAPGACSDSDVAMATYTVSSPEGGAPADAAPDARLPPCNPPMLVPNGGSPSLGSTVAIAPPIGFPANFPRGAGAVYYTTDGSQPTRASAAYVGPIQLSDLTGTEMIQAIADYPGVCTDSTPVVANYAVIEPDGGFLPPPLFHPPSTTQDNDFLVQLTDTSPAATICFTLGAGATPTCTVTTTAATCSGTSQTYVAAADAGQPGSAAIQGGVTDANGSVTINAIACQPGNAATAVVSQAYALKVATPTMQGPAPSTALTFAGAPFAPTVASVTAGSTLRYTVDGTTTPTCNTGTLLVDNQSQPVNPGAPNPAVTQNITYMGIGCKPGYAPSNPATFAYGIVLPRPRFVNANTTSMAQGTGTYDRALSTEIAAVSVMDIYACYGAGGTTAACGAASTCSAGTKATVAAGDSPTGIAVSMSGTVLNAVACSPEFNASASATATYTLQLDAPGLDAPGCLLGATPGSCRTAGSSAPSTMFSIPANQIGAFTPSIEQWIGTPPPGSGAQPGYQFVCALNGGAPACGATGCTAGALIMDSALRFQTANTVSLGNMVSVGDSWSVIGCPGSTSPGFLPSSVTTVVFTGP